MNESNLQETLKKAFVSDDLLTQCMHCGMCLPTCPTYNVTKLESSSPRGRIRLIKSVAEGKLEINDTFINEINYCLDCQACETACPAGVKYGAIVEAAREEVSRKNLEPLKNRVFRRFGLNFVLANQPLLKLVAKFLYFYQNSGLRHFLHSIGFFKILGTGLDKADQLSPSISKRFSSDVMEEVYSPAGPVRYRVLLPVGCLMDVAFADIHSDTLNVLLQHGCEVIIPRNQGCCGSLHAHNGEQRKARQLAQKTYNQFSKYNFDFIISNSAGCGAYMKEYGHLLEPQRPGDPETRSGEVRQSQSHGEGETRRPGDPETRSGEVTVSQNNEVTGNGQRATGNGSSLLATHHSLPDFSAKVKDLSEFLAETGFMSENYEFNGSVTYHDACHLAHTQKVTKEPREIIRSVKNVHYTELDEASWCCGSAGIYNVSRYDDALHFLTRKMDNLDKTRSDVVIMANPGCMGQIKHGTEKFNKPMEVLHLATFLNRSYRPPKK